MNPKGQQFFKLLCNRYHGGDVDSLTKYLAPEEVGFLQGVESDVTDLNQFLNHSEESLQNIHYSWMKPVFEKIPDHLRPLYLGCLKSVEADGLSRLLGNGTSSLTIPDPLKPFFVRRLIDKLGNAFSQGGGTLADSPLLGLFDVEKKKLLKIIDLLGLHDLAEEMRHIVDKKKLGLVYKTLPPSMQAHLKVCLKQKHRIPTKRLSLDQWNGTEKQLLNLVHRRGLATLSKAISGQEPKFAWKLSRYLDTGRGQLILKNYKKKPYPKITAPLVSEINYLIQRLNQ